MIDEQVLLSTIIAAPDDDRPRLAYADWLEEHGQRDRARLIRVQIELARLPENKGDPTALQIEVEQLEAVCEKTLPPLEGITWGSFERGIVRSVYADTPATFHRHASCIAEMGAVDRLALEKTEDFAALAQVSSLARFTELRIWDSDDPHTYARNGDPGHRFNDDLQAVLASPHCPRLRNLELVTCQLGPRGAKALADCPRMESLVNLDLLDNYVGDDGLAALAASPYLTALRNLRIDLNNIGPAGVEALVASASLGGLVELFLGEFSPHAIGPAAGVALARSPYLTSLRELRLHDDIGALGAAALAQAPNLAGLTYLDIRSVIGPEGVQALAASPYLRQLKSLELVWIGDEGARALASSPVLATLEYLDVSGRDLTDEGAHALAASPYLGRLKPGGLDIGRWNDQMTVDGIHALRTRFGDRLSAGTDIRATEHQGESCG